MKTLEEILSHHPFFKDLKSDYISFLAGCGINKVFQPGELLGHEGEKADYFYIIREGKIAIQIFPPGGNAITVQTIGKNDIVGWSWLFPPYQWHFDIKAIETTQTIALDGQCLRNKCEEDHDLGYILMKKFSQIMVRRLHATRMQMLDIYKETVDR